MVSYTVQQRTQGFGIRTTLGAQRGDIMKLVPREVTRAVGHFGG